MFRSANLCICLYGKEFQCLKCIKKLVPYSYKFAGHIGITVWFIILTQMKYNILRFGLATSIYPYFNKENRVLGETV